MNNKRRLVDVHVRCLVCIAPCIPKVGSQSAVVGTRTIRNECTAYLLLPQAVRLHAVRRFFAALAGRLRSCKLALNLRLNRRNLRKSIAVVVESSSSLLFGKLLVLTEQTFFKLVVCLGICA